MMHEELAIMHAKFAASILLPICLADDQRNRRARRVAAEGRARVPCGAHYAMMGTGRGGWGGCGAASMRAARSIGHEECEEGDGYGRRRRALCVPPRRC